MDINFEKMGISPQEHERNKAALQREMLASTMEPFSFEAFKKTPEERAEIATAKAAWREYMRQHGFGRHTHRVNAN